MTAPPAVRQVRRYVLPLREGGSLPAIVEGDDDGLYVLKFAGAGQGRNALVAEWLGAGVGRALGLPVPEVLPMQLDGELARTEADPEIQHLIRASHGLNLGVDYLPGAVGFDPATMPVDADTASRIVWLDALIENIDRTARNPNLLLWHGVLRPIDHGAAFSFHHRWQAGEPPAFDAERAGRPFAGVDDHVLLRAASRIAALDATLAAALGGGVLEGLVESIPDDWLGMRSDGTVDRAEAGLRRGVYLAMLRARLQTPRRFADHAAQRQQAVGPPTRP